LQLQDSCREARNEVQELRQENARLRHEFREREKFWRALWQTRKTNQGPESDDLPPLPPSISSSHAQNGHLHQYGGASLTYRINEDPSLSNNSYNSGPSHYQNSHSPSMPYVGINTDPSNDTSLNAVSHRGTKYSSYPYSVQGIPREGPWVGLSTSPGGESGAGTSSHSSHSPGHAETPGVTSPEMPYAARFPIEDQKVSLSSLDTAPYVFPSSRSLSPATSTPGSSSSTPMTTSSTSMTSFPFTFSDAAAQERVEFEYRRHVHPPGTEVTLHGGTADISLAGSQSDALRYRLPTRSSNSSDRPLLPGLPHFSSNDIGAPYDRGSSDGDATLCAHPRMRPRHGNAPSRSSRSPSPGAPTLSGTLAVIKAQAFGALRRTRARTKKSSEGAAKVAMDVLEARGIGIGVSTGSKRPRLHDDELDMSDT